MELEKRADCLLYRTVSLMLWLNSDTARRQTTYGRKIALMSHPLEGRAGARDGRVRMTAAG